MADRSFNVLSPERPSTSSTVKSPTGECPLPTVTADAARVLSPQDVEVVLYHHPCADGSAAAYAAQLVLGDTAIYVPVQIASEPPWDLITGKNVAIFDYAYPSVAVMEQVRGVCRNLVLLDHHTSAKDILSELNYCFFDIQRSGAALAWYYFHPDEEIPHLFRLIEDKDLWTWVLADSKEFAAAFDLVDLSLETMARLNNEEVIAEMIERGRIILEFQENAIERTCRKAGRRRLAGHSTLMVNSSYWMSEVANHLALKSAIGLCFTYDSRGKQYNVSLRCADDRVDVSKIARIYGGGGHARAAGFSYKGASIEEIFDK